MLKVKTFPFNMFQVNTYVVYDQKTGEAMIVDPGMISKSEQTALTDFIVDNNLTIRYLVNTHMHLDHIFGNKFVERAYGVTTSAHSADLPLGRQLPQQARMFGVPGEYDITETVNPIDEQTVLKLGDENIEVLHVPGHSPGGIALYAPQSHFVIAGDSLFKNGIGRTDLPGGNYYQLIDSIRRKLLKLPNDTIVYTGHGPSTTIGA